MNKSQFVNKDNLELLWEVLLDELNINQTNTNLITNVKTIFQSNINLFVSRSNPKTTILEQNKQFLNQVLLAVNQLLPQQNMKRINITDEIVNEPYKIEDIQAARKTDFEKELERKKMELDNYLTITKPKELDFTDKNFTSLPGMEVLLANKLVERNLDFDPIYSNTLNIKPEEWLTPKKTSLNSEKMEETKNISNEELKYINNNNNIINNIINNKKVSFNENIKTNIVEEVPNSNSISIFQKLKKTIIENESEFPLEQTKYEQQQSILLPKQEEILKNDSNSKSKINQNIIQNVPIISNNEIIKQLNEMNYKIDKLYEIVTKLTKIDCIDKNITDED